MKLEFRFDIGEIVQEYQVKNAFIGRVTAINVQKHKDSDGTIEVYRYYYEVTSGMVVRTLEEKKLQYIGKFKE